MQKLLATACLVPVLALAQAERSLALLTEASQAQLIRSGNRLPVSARPGDLLFAGDRLIGGTVRAVACHAVTFPGSTSQIQWEIPSPCALPALVRDVSGVRSEDSFPDETRPGSPFRKTSLGASIVEAELAAEDDPAKAAELYREIRRDHPAAREIAAQRLFVLEADAIRRRQAKSSPAPEGKTLALLVGISEFENAQVRPLRYAHEDALAFERFLKSPRGGGLSAQDVTTLINRQATAAAIRDAFDALVAKSKPGDTIVLLLATHGAVVENPRSKSRGAYIVAYDSDPEDLGATAVSMGRVQSLLRDDLKSAGRVVAFVDACRAGTIGTIPDKSKLKVAAALDALTQTESQLFLFTASRPGEVSFEGRQYGGGHGAFSYFVLSALNGAADFDSDGKVTLNEMSSFVQQKVAEATLDKQHPREGGTLDANVRLADISRPGIELGSYRPDARDAKEDVSRSIAGAAARPAALGWREAVDLDRALADGRLLPDQPENAFTALRQLKQSRTLTRDQIVEGERRLRVALEDRNQQVLVRYLRGDERPLSKQDFVDAARTVSAAMQMKGETPDLLSRLLLCEGRIAMFEKRFDDAQRSLELALRLDSTSAQIFNALGAAFFEQGDFERALLAFDDAIVRAPYWVYPRNSRALAHAERGDYDQALAAFDEALKMAPASASLQHNRAWLLQRIGQIEDARRGYETAIRLNPALAAPWNALGTIEAVRGHWDAAEQAYRKALDRLPGFTEARINLARLLDRRGRRADALKLASEALDAEPRSPELLLMNARLLLANGRAPEAESLLARLPDQANSLSALECQGEVLAALGRSEEARARFESALQMAVEDEDEKRLKRRLRHRP